MFMLEMSRKSRFRNQISNAESNPFSRQYFIHPRFLPTKFLEVTALFTNSRPINDPAQQSYPPIASGEVHQSLLHPELIALGRSAKIDTRRLLLIKMIKGLEEVLILLFTAFGYEYFF
ncbi:unnamed protein product [Bathycoccus prasinos]